MKWYFCIDEIGANEEIGDWSVVALQSAVKRGDIQPICLYDGSNSNSYLRTIQELGAKIIHTKSGISDAIEQANRISQYPLHARGAFLRAEISQHEEEDAFVLYTDCDVYFRPIPISWQGLSPSIFAAGPRQNLNDIDQFNSGVMVINVEKFRSIQQEFLQFAAKNLGPFLPGVDEPIFNAFFKGKFDPLPVGLNWRPFFGHNKSAPIIHFHGPKLRHLEEFTRDGASVDWGIYANDLTSLIASSLKSYRMFVVEILENTTPPARLAERMLRFLDGYEKLSNDTFSRFGQTTLSNSDLRRYIDRRSGIIADQMRTLIRKIDPYKLKCARFIVPFEFAKYPHIMLSLFENNGIGIVLGLLIRLDDGSVMEVDPSKLPIFAGRSLGVETYFGQEGIIFANGGYPVRLLLDENIDRNRAKISSIELLTLSAEEEPLVITFADTKMQFFDCNRVTINAIAIGEASVRRIEFA